MFFLIIHNLKHVNQLPFCFNILKNCKKIMISSSIQTNILFELNVESSHIGTCEID